MATILMRRRWRWIGHITSQEASTRPRPLCIGHRRESEGGAVLRRKLKVGGKENEADGKGMEKHSSYDEGLAKVEGPRCYPTPHPSNGHE